MLKHLTKSAASSVPTRQTIQHALAKNIVGSAVAPRASSLLSPVVKASIPTQLRQSWFAEQLTAINLSANHSSFSASRNYSRTPSAGSPRPPVAAWIRQHATTPHQAPCTLIAKNSAVSRYTGSRNLVGIPFGDQSAKERFQTVLQEYGKVVLLSHTVVWGASLIATTAALNAMDLSSAIALLPESIASHVDPKAGAFAIAFVLVKLTGPVRLMFDIAITPTLASYLRGTALAGPLGLRKREKAAARGARESYRDLMGLAGPVATQQRERLHQWSGQTVLFVKSKYAVLRSRRKFAPPGLKEQPGQGPAVRVPKTLTWTLKEHNSLLRARKAGTRKRDSSALAPLRPAAATHP